MVTDFKLGCTDVIVQKFSEYIELNNADLLEIGIGKGRFGAVLAKHFSHYYGIDHHYMVEAAKSLMPKNLDITYTTGTAENIPFQRAFDIVFYTLSWHFINNFEKAISEVDRVLEKDGLLTVIEPTADSQNWGGKRMEKRFRIF